MNTLKNWQTYGVTGSRKLTGDQSRRLRHLLTELRELHGGLLRLYTGDATGADAIARHFGAYDFRVKDYKGNYRAQLAQRSQAMADKVREEGGALIAVPTADCPKGINGFNGSGSGTWATAHYAWKKGTPIILLWTEPHWGEWEKTAEGLLITKEDANPQLTLF